MAFGMSRRVYVASEGSPFIGYNTENGGYVGADYSFPNSAANADTLLMLRNALVLEELEDDIETGKLFLLRGAPRAWFEPGKTIRFQRLATYYGDISFTCSSDASGRRIQARVDPPPGRWSSLEISFRYPGSRPIRQVKVNGANHTDFDLEGIVRLAHADSPLLVEVFY
jgi:hypothetical protein